MVGKEGRACAIADDFVFFVTSAVRCGWETAQIRWRWAWEGFGGLSGCFGITVYKIVTGHSFITWYL